MAGAKKTWKKISDPSKLKKDLLPNPFKKGAMERSHANPLRVADDSVEDVGDLFTPDIPEVPEETIIPIPDGNTAETAARKRRAKKGGSGRSSTILTEGLGG